MRAIRRVFCVPIARLRAIQHTGAYCPAGQYSAFFASIAHAGNTTRFLCAYCPLAGNTAHWRLLPCWAIQRLFRVYCPCGQYDAFFVCLLPACGQYSTLAPIALRAIRRLFFERKK